MASSGRKSIPDPVTNRLFALSGNQCAFPGCTNAVTDQVAPGEQPVTLAQRAHIVGVGRQGPRSRAAPLSDDIDAVENLTLLCGEHHRIVDANPRIYSVEVLAKYKADHEARMAAREPPAAPPPCGDRHGRSVAAAGRRTAGHRVEGDVAVPHGALRSVSICRGRGAIRSSRSCCSRARSGHSTTSPTPEGPFKQAVDPGTAERLDAATAAEVG